MRTEVLFLGGRSGVGKTSAAIAMHELLKRRDVQHAVIEGDNLDLAHPAPHLAFPSSDLAARNLRTMWRNYRELGYHRLVYTNTASVLHTAELAAAMDDDPLVTAVLLRASDAVAGRRLHGRAMGTAPDAELDHSARTAAHLDDHVPARVHRIDTDRLTPAGVAQHLVDLLEWRTP